MHQIEPFYRWEKYYQATADRRSPFYGQEYNTQEYTNNIYGYYIHPYWDYIGSETLYVKLLFVDESRQIAIIEFIGEWNDTLYNDVMFLKNNVIDALTYRGIIKFILIGENVFNFHGSDDCYYEEWFEEVSDGWIVGINFRKFVLEEWKKYNIDYYINFGGELDVVEWRTLTPMQLFQRVEDTIQKRLGS
jgi:hypothetical protein